MAQTKNRFMPSFASSVRDIYPVSGERRRRVYYLLFIVLRCALALLPLCHAVSLSFCSTSPSCAAAVLPLYYRCAVCHAAVLLCCRCVVLSYCCLRGAPCNAVKHAGPRDDEFAGKKFSFVRLTSIFAVIPNSKEYEEAAREAGALQAEIEKAAGAGSGLVF